MTIETLAVDAILVVFAAYAIWKPLFIGNGLFNEYRQSLAYAFGDAANQPDRWPAARLLDMWFSELLDCAYCSSAWIVAGVTSLLLFAQVMKLSFLVGLIFVLTCTGILDVVRTATAFLRKSEEDDSLDPVDLDPADSGTHGYDHAVDLEARDY